MPPNRANAESFGSVTSTLSRSRESSWIEAKQIEFLQRNENKGIRFIDETAVLASIAILTIEIDPSLMQAADDSILSKTEGKYIIHIYDQSGNASKNIEMIH